MALELEQITKKLGRETHLDAIDLHFANGSLNVLLGPTLAGKTSIMRLLAGLDRPTSGRLLVDGVDVTGRPVRERRVAMVYQRFINYPSFNVYDNIASPLRRAGLAKSEIDRKVREVAEMLMLGDLLQRLPAELSGGQQQRTALARALVKDADLLCLDEPLVNLDFKQREELRGELREILATRDAAVVYATTEPLEALLLSGHTVIMDAGSVLQTGATVDVFSRPASLRVAEIFSDPPINQVPGIVERGAAKLGAGIGVPLAPHLRALRSGTYRFGVRANHLFVSRRHQDDVEFAATVELAEINGSETLIRATSEGIPWVVQEEGVHRFGLGQQIKVFLSPADIYAFDAGGALLAAPDRGTT